MQVAGRLEAACKELAKAAQDTVASASASCQEPPDGPRRRLLRQAAAALLARLAPSPGWTGPAADDPRCQMPHLLHACLPKAAWLAQLLDQWQAEPSALADAQLELAQACATRACAFLRCANLGQAGGAAAGEGAGSRKCSGCRVAW